MGFGILRRDHARNNHSRRHYQVSGPSQPLGRDRGLRSCTGISVDTHVYTHGHQLTQVGQEGNRVPEETRATWKNGYPWGWGARFTNYWWTWASRPCVSTNSPRPASTGPCARLYGGSEGHVALAWVAVWPLSVSLLCVFTGDAQPYSLESYLELYWGGGCRRKPKRTIFP